MRSQMIQKSIKYSLCGLMFVVVFIGIYELYKTIRAYNRLGIVTLSDKANAFHSAPKISTCISLMDDYINLNDYEKGLYYANYCIGLGVDNTPIGWLLHLKMSYVYSIKGDLYRSCNELGVAIKLDKEYMICKGDYLDQLNLRNLLNGKCDIRYCDQ
jgi:hypothetical protein